MGYRAGKALVFTDLCVFRLDQTTRALTVVEIMPGVTRPQIQNATGFPVTFAADCIEVSPPSDDMLAVLRSQIDPLGLRRLEFVSAKERGALIAEILAADRAMVERCVAAQKLIIAS